MKEDIIRMAREASFVWEDLGILDRLAFYKFAALVAAAEREACAKLCEPLDETDMRSRYDYRRRLLDCADAIRARGQQ